MHIAHICSFKNGVHSSQLNLNNCVLSIRYLIDITLCSPKLPPFGRFMLNSNSCFPNYPPNNISFVEYNALFLILPHPAENISQQMNAFSKKISIPTTLQKHVSRFTTHPPTFARKHQIEGHNKMHKKQRQTSSKSKACGYLFS